MKIAELLKIIKFNELYNVPFIPMDAGMLPEDKPAIYGKKDGIHYFRDDTCFGVSCSNNGMEKLKIIKSLMRDWFYTIPEGGAIYEYYISIAEILEGVDRYNRKNKNGFPEVLSKENLRKYVDLIVEYVKSNLDFTQVSDMLELKKRIAEDNNYSQYVFNVEILESKKEDQYRGCSKTCREYVFGNVKYFESLDRVSLKIYDDEIELWHRRAGRNISKTVDWRHLAKHTYDAHGASNDESKILRALYEWIGYYAD